MKFKYYSLKLCLLIIIVFILQIIFPAFTGLFILNKLSFEQPWRFLTSIFLHGSGAHLILNLFALALFGSILERLISSEKTLMIFLSTGILANLISVLFYDSSLGASGAIFGIIGTLIIVRPLMVIWAFGMPMPIFIAGILWAIGDILGTYGYLAGNPIDSTGNIAHLSGMFFGFFFGFILRKFYGRKIRKNY
ncbi:rhomboid family intramembrane serine protease [Candidatus Pacearchaeota archaeon]|nr:rhomboid family intramembrane serine protease [Candidatus Pacearchaeota archaeon]